MLQITFYQQVVYIFQNHLVPARLNYIIGVGRVFMKQYPVQEDQNVTSHHSQTILNTSILYSPFLQAAITSHLFPGKYCVPIFHILLLVLWNYVKSTFPLLVKNSFLSERYFYRFPQIQKIGKNYCSDREYICKPCDSLLSQ